MKICFIGLCGHSMQAYDTIKKHQDIEVCGVAPGSKEEELHPWFDRPVSRFDDYRVMLEETRPDMAVVSPIFGLTGQVVLDCAARGVDVLCEKPVANSLEELERIRGAVKTSGIRFCAMHYLRFRPSFYGAAALVRSGAIGEVKMLTAQKSYKFGVRPSWYNDRSLYCGTIPWVGIHAIDWIAAFSGKRYRRVKALHVGKPERTALCQYELEDGVIAAVNIDFYRPQDAPTHDDDRIRCVGSEGVLEVRNDRVTLIDRQGERSLSFSEAPDLTEEFLCGRQPISPDEIFFLTKVALLSRESADSGEERIITD